MTTMTATNATPTHSWKPQVLSATFATMTVAVISDPVRNSSNRFVYRGRSSVMLSSAAAPPRPSRVISSNRAGETIVIAASAAASRPAIGTSAAATTSNSTSVLDTVGSAPSARREVAVVAWLPPVIGEPDRVQHGRVDRGQPRPPGKPGAVVAPGVQQLVLQPEHLPLL